MDPTQVTESHVQTGTPVVGQAAVPVAHSAVSQSSTTVAPVGYRASQLVWLVVGIVNVVLAFDFLFRALKANDTGFADFIYSLGGALAAPFDGIFGVAITNSSLVIRWGDLLGMVIYALLATAIVKVIHIAATPNNSTTTTTTV